jgi:cytochrome b subunit of formate dehydrogenase
MPKHVSYKRFSISDRAEHWLLTLSFGLLALTGLVQQHVDWELATGIINLFGGIENVRLIHHIAAIVMMFEAIYHIGVLGYKFFVLRLRPTILPGKGDALNLVQSVRYNLDRTKDRPKQGRFTFEEKLEYWAVVWGTVVMGVTGFMLWNPIAATHVLPGDLVPAAKAAHGKEALLAVLAILIWHVYHVHLRHLNLSMFKGTLKEEEMADEHAAELDEIQAGYVDPRPDAAVLARRRRVFYPVYGVLTLAMLAGVWFFVGFEKTAITTVPPAEDVVVFVPLPPTPLPTLPPTPTPLPPTPTPLPSVAEPGATAAPAAGATWESGIGELMVAKCGACHNSTDKLGELDLSTYGAALAGGVGGPSIVPGEVHTSLLVSRQTSGKHPGMFSAEELERVTQWIEAGALEK